VPAAEVPEPPGPISDAKPEFGGDPRGRLSPDGVLLEC
jgi:hypothetical protein